MKGFLYNNKKYLIKIEYLDNTELNDDFGIFLNVK